MDRAKNLIGKPLEIAENLAKIAAAAEPATSSIRRKLVGRAGREYFLLDIAEVLALQAEGELVWIVTPKRRYLASRTLRSLEAGLQPLSFQRVHRNAIVNIDHIRKVTSITSHRWLLTLTNDLEFVVSKRQAHNIRRLLQR